jgi:hypothetical protein
MEHWSSEQRAFAVKAYYKNNDSFVGAQRAFCRQFSLSPRDPVSSHGTIDLWIKNFETTASMTQNRGGSKKTSWIQKNVERVRV